MNTLVTGASGFLGHHVVDQLLAAGHKVWALVRPGHRSPPLPASQRLQVVRADLRRRRDPLLTDALQQADTVIHLAAAKTGDLYAQLADTVVGTEHLLDAMLQANVGRMVAISSFSVYSYRDLASWSTLDESSPLEPCPDQRDAYTQAKLLQEEIIVTHTRQHAWCTTVLRPGAIFGPDQLLPARAGLRLTDTWWLQVGWFTPLPLTYVENCAQAIALAALRAEPGCQILNIVDDAPPSCAAYLTAIKTRNAGIVHRALLPWPIMKAAAWTASTINQHLFNQRARLPGLLAPARVHARFKPLRYSNARARRVLGWQPLYTLDQALDRAVAAQQQRSPAPDATRLEESHP